MLFLLSNKQRAKFPVAFFFLLITTFCNFLQHFTTCLPSTSTRRSSTPPSEGTTVRLLLAVVLFATSKKLKHRTDTRCEQRNYCHWAQLNSTFLNPLYHFLAFDE